MFSKIRAALGIMSTIISGGGSLAGHLDDFFEVRLPQNTICLDLLRPSPVMPVFNVMLGCTVLWAVSDGVPLLSEQMSPCMCNETSLSWRRAMLLSQG